MLTEEEKRLRRNASQIRYYERNKESVLKYQKEYKQKNKDRILKRDRQYREVYYSANRDSILAKHKRNRKQNPVVVKAIDIKSDIRDNRVLALNLIASRK